MQLSNVAVTLKAAVGQPIDGSHKLPDRAIRDSKKFRQELRYASTEKSARRPAFSIGFAQSFKNPLSSPPSQVKAGENPEKYLA